MEPLAYIGVPIDSVNRRDGGCERSPAVLRELGLPAALGGADGGDLEVRIRGEERDPATGVLAGPDVLSATATIRGAVAELLGDGARPFLAGGCCAALPGALAGARDALGTIGLVHFDGHADLYDGETSATGEAADMPVSVALGLGPAGWVEVAGGASVVPARTALVGFRDQAESVGYGMRQPETLDPPPLLFPAAELRARSFNVVGRDLPNLVGAPFWLHFDVDVLDERVFPATDYLMPGGLGWGEAKEVLDPLLASSHLIGASVGCYNPGKDTGLNCGRGLVAAFA
ncbi:MAG TPA: arginase family protein [Solirubrobacterales bacterium]|nr:arginase family protein [Solirubrobacterales bacterium]